MVHVNDASRAVGVASSLLSPEKNDTYAAEIRTEYAKISDAHLRAQADKKRLKLQAARNNPVPVDFAKAPPKKPAFIGIKSLDYIDWTPFFQAWELSGPYPKILQDPVVGEAARKLHAEALDTLDRIVNEKWVSANGVLGLYPAARVDGDDIEIYRDESRRDGRHDLAQPAPAEQEADRTRQPVPRGLRRTQRKQASQTGSAPPSRPRTTTTPR